MADYPDASLFQNRTRADSFGAKAEQYDRARPAYPAEMIDALVGDGTAQVLDVGCGTGIVTRLFTDRGCTVLGLEPDPRMAAVARRRGAQVEEGTFEAWNAQDRRFDLLVAGQAWHWVDPKAGAHKAAEVLRPGGRIGLFWNQSFPGAEARHTMETVYRALAPELASNSVLLGERDDSLYQAIAQALSDTGRFADVHLEYFDHQVTYSTTEWLDLAGTHSDHHTLPEGQLEPLLAALGKALDAAGGQVPIDYETTLVTGTTLSR
jgi:SAM-dependent methyltransferase